VWVLAFFAFSFSNGKKLIVPQRVNPFILSQQKFKPL